MYYEINVSQNGKHFFATAERSIRDERDLKAVYTKFKTAFPASEGFALHVTQRMTVGKPIDMEGI